MLYLRLECFDPEALAKKLLANERFKLAATPISDDCFNHDALIWNVKDEYEHFWQLSNSTNCTNDKQSGIA
ncbi:hypothetical protein Pyn_08196 [Prunus yedoensis var. nudiflora]|uniref:Uncharacterized protein n=1 Tax=Prunus yedoensis var. nudiflora TaxID=2094558 RepID=A0A314XYF6_PRUYE|nr:hypothetical protein Pyn_08196 [Prunus yedoensis var. nudiflora]